MENEQEGCKPLASLSFIVRAYLKRLNLKLHLLIFCVCVRTHTHTYITNTTWKSENNLQSLFFPPYGSQDW